MTGRWMLLLLILGSACLRPDSATVERLARGGRADRLAAVVRDGRAAPEVRAQAASWLLTEGHAPLAMATLQQLPAERRGPVVAYLLHHFLPAVLERDAERGRQALLLVRPMGTPDSVARTDTLMLTALGEQLDRDRALPAGGSITELLRTVGPERGEALLPLVGRPGAPHEQLMQVLSADAKLLERARARLVEQVAAPGAPADPAAWATLARWGPWRPLADRLTGTAPEPALAAARALAAAPRDPALAQLALDRIGDRGSEPPLRHALLAVVERAGSPAVVPALLALIPREQDHPLAYRSYLTAVLLGGPDVVVRALEAFPRRWRHDERPVASFLVEGTLGLGPEGARAAARRALRSRSPLARHVGVRLLERVGQPGDAALLRRLRGDRARVRGLEARATVGEEAARVHQLLLQPPRGVGRDGDRGQACRLAETTRLCSSSAAAGLNSTVSVSSSTSQRWPGGA